MWWLYVKLFYSFFKIGLFGFGGGYAMISLIQGEVVNRYHWLTSGQFTDIVAISQMTPGPIGINSATYVGYTSVVNAGYGHGWAVLGSVTATFAVVLPSFILMLLISKFLMKFKNHPVVEHVPGFASGCGRVVGGGSFAVAHTGKLRYTGQSVAVLYQYFSFCLCLYR